LIDPRQFNLEQLAQQALQIGGRLIVEPEERVVPSVLSTTQATARAQREFEPPVVALGQMFRCRLRQIYECKVLFHLEMNCRPTTRVLGGYYKKRRLVRIYTHDIQTGRRPMDELFETFLHEVAHHIEYTEPESFRAASCGRVHGRMHSRLFWRILRVLKRRWEDLQLQSRLRASVSTQSAPSPEC